MHEKVKQLSDALDALQLKIHESPLPTNALDTIWGWSYHHISKEDIASLIHNFNDRFKKYAPSDLTSHDTELLDYQLGNIKRLIQDSNNFFQNNSQVSNTHLPIFISSLQIILSDLESNFLSFDSISDSDLLPKKLHARLRSVKSSIKALEENCVDLDKKTEVILSAYQAADSLPTDIDALKEAKKQIDSYLKSSKEKIDSALERSEESLEAMRSIEKKSNLTYERCNELLKKIDLAKNQANERVEQCDDALKIATTQGLAAGFDQKATELKKSIWYYIAGLIVALGIGAFIGYLRVEDLTKAASMELTTGQALLHTIMSIFSIGGPLWLAWICTQQINQRFKLSEDYSYKATVTKSFVGFSSQAQRFSPETEERLFNSTLDRLEEMPLRLIEGKDYNSPWHEFIDSEAFKSAAASFPELITAAGRFANNTKLKNKTANPKVTPKSPSPELEAVD
ncbi:TPA: hypothetical protein KD875_000860 [Vibrio cholerae]|nr:hypothetical protein [Vibrio cholerae]